MMLVHYQDENGNELDLNDAFRYDPDKLVIIDPVYHIKKVRDKDEIILALAKAVQILENRLRIEYATHAWRYDSCKAGRCDDIMDLRNARKELEGLI